ncbi:MAG: hypothetical protein HZB53_07730 [Chloroflexi bacterium]|nr:hypothetical protein [Chloroflexota bacterium]
MDALFELLHSILPPGAGDAVGVFVSAALTVMIFTYVVGDNLFFRIAQHMLIGAVAAYAVVAAVHQVLLGQLLAPLAAHPDTQYPLLAPLALGVMLLTRIAPGTAWIGRVPVAFLLGVGAAAAVSGAVLGTLLPQGLVTARSLFDGAGPDATPVQQGVQVFNNVLMLAGTLGVLVSFQFVRGNRSLAGRAFNAVVALWGALGRGFIWVALGALFAGLVLSRVTLLVGRIQFLLEAFRLAVR